MDDLAFDTWTRRTFGLATGGLAAAGLLGLGGLHDADAKKKKKKKKCKGCCTKSGSSCKKKSKKCKASFCLNAPFTITAAWTVEADHDTFLFVPQEVGSTDPSPYIDYSCNVSDDPCNTQYPFACVDGDETSAGDEITTIYQLLAGKYEYWIELESTSAAGDLTITLRDNDGRTVRTWTNPAVPGADQVGWHVFDIDGTKGTISSIDQLISDSLPDGAHDPNTDVCP